MHARARSKATDTQYTGIRRGAAVGGSLLLAVLFSLTFGMFGGSATAADILQCDAQGLDGSGTVCTVVVANNLDNTNPAAPVATAVVTTTTCFGAADAAEAGVCTQTVTNYTELVTDINQCNYAANGGGATLECDVTVTNTIIGDAPVTPVPVTVNQCNNSLDDPAGEVNLCDPDPATTDPSTATIVQCNDSDNGGGSVLICDVTPLSTITDVIPVTINQCNNSANGGGSTVICRSRITTTIIKVTPPVEEEEEEEEETPPIIVTPPGDTGGGGDTSGGETTDTSTDRLANTGLTAAERLERLAQTGPTTDPSLLIGGALTLLLFGTVGIVSARRSSGSPR